MHTQQSEDVIHKEIVGQLIAATPEWWDYAVLTLCQSSRGDVDACAHSISNPDHPSDCVEATEELMAATRSLALSYKKRGTPWVKAVYEIRQQPDGRWNFRTDFTYESE